MISLIIFLLIPLAFSCLTYAFFWYEAANSSHRSYLEELSGGRLRRLLLRSILLSYRTSILTIFLYPFCFSRRLWKMMGASENTTSPPIILIHGLYHNTSAWIFYLRWLRKAGYDRLYYLSFNSLRCNFSDLTEKLERLIAEIRARENGRAPVIIGHSLGGLVARYCAERPGSRARPAAVITLGTPHQGSKLAALGVGKLARSLLYRGTLIQEMESLSPSETIPRIALYSPLDNMVLPTSALQAETAGWVHHETDPISHVAMLYHKPTAQIVIRYLDTVAGIQRD